MKSLRIVSGKYKGRRIHQAKSEKTRPTGERVREAVFNILADDIAGASFLDLYAGTGAMGVEALSRGARYVVFVEHYRKQADAIKETLDNLDAGTSALVLPYKVSSAINHGIEGSPFDFVFIDPPYFEGIYEKTLQLLAKSRIITEKSVIITESHKRMPLHEASGYAVKNERSYGDTIVTFLVRE